jgi:antitoxin CcdA
MGVPAYPSWAINLSAGRYATKTRRPAVAPCRPLSSPVCRPLPAALMRINLAHELEATAMVSDRPARKRAVNLFVDAELLDHARRMRINMSETLERRLRSLVRTELEKQWLQDNQEAIAQYNRRVAEQGLLADDAGLL